MECSRIEGHRCIAPVVVRSRLQCGSGTLCCKVYALPELAKPPGVRLDENIGGLGFYIGLRAGLPVRPS
jgi:hypothetical protein